MVAFGEAWQGSFYTQTVVSLVSQNIAANTSTIDIWVNFWAAPGWWVEATFAVDAHVNYGQVFNTTVTSRVGNGQPLGKTLGHNRVTVQHDSDGTLMRDIGGTVRVTNPNILPFHQTSGGTFVFPTIPRATIPNVSGGSFTTGAEGTINLPRAAPGFTHDVTWSFEGGQSGTIATGAGVTAKWTPPHSLFSAVTGKASNLVGIKVVTRNGSTVIGSPRTEYFPLNLAASQMPVVSAVTWDDANPTVKAAIGAFVQGLSLVRGTVTAAGIHSSTIVGKGLVVAGTRLEDGTQIQPQISGTVVASGEATDSRGRVGTRAANFSVLPYEPPKLGVNGWQVRRANSSNVVTDQGTYLRLDLHAHAKSLIAGAEKNALTVRVFTRPANGGAWVARNVINPGLTHNGAVQLTGGAAFPVAQSFDVKVELTDKTGVAATVLQTPVTTATVTLDMNGVNVGIGGYHERGTLDVKGDGWAHNWRADQGVYAGGAILDPLGSGKLWFMDAAPQGWLLCQGQAVSRATYAGLFALLGVTWGAGDGSTTFNLPDMRGVVPVGKSADAEFNALAKKYGTKTHTLTTAELSPHEHASWGTYNIGPGAGATAMVINQGTGGNTRSNGGGQPHNNIQPSVTVNWIIRAL